MILSSEFNVGITSNVTVKVYPYPSYILLRLVYVVSVATVPVLILATRVIGKVDKLAIYKIFICRCYYLVLEMLYMRMLCQYRIRP